MKFKATVFYEHFNVIFLTQKVFNLSFLARLVGVLIYYNL